MPESPNYKPYEIADQLASATNPEEILTTISENDPFWVGASYAIDPFVGIIVRLPMRRDPNQYGEGLAPEIFEKLVKAIIEGKLTGDELILTLEAVSGHCQEGEWLRWYKRILQGEMDIHVPLAVFNRYAPPAYQIPPPVLNKPKPIQSFADLPQRFVLQPEYPRGRMFWLVDSEHQPIEIYGYDGQIRRVRDPKIYERLAAFARTRPLDIVITGYSTGGSFIAEDIITREQFTQENSPAILSKRIEAMNRLGIPITQMSPELHPSKTDAFFKELSLIFEQGYKAAVIRDLDARYPFRVQADLLVAPSVKTTVTCDEVIEGVGLKCWSVRGDKTIRSIIRLGLTSSIWKDISESSPIGRRLDVLSCGQKDQELLLPIFQNWRK